MPIKKTIKTLAPSPNRQQWGNCPWIHYWCTVCCAAPVALHNKIIFVTIGELKPPTPTQPPLLEDRDSLMMMILSLSSDLLIFLLSAQAMISSQIGKKKRFQIVRDRFRWNGPIKIVNRTSSSKNDLIVRFESCWCKIDLNRTIWIVNRTILITMIKSILINQPYSLDKLTRFNVMKV